MNLIPESEPKDPRSADANASQGSLRRTRRNPIPTREEILAQIRSLIGAITLGLVSTAQGSVMLRGLIVLLNETKQNQKGGTGAVNVEHSTCDSSPKSRIDRLLSGFLDGRAIRPAHEARNGLGRIKFVAQHKEVTMSKRGFCEKFVRVNGQPFSLA